jgi:hypothetical protein
MPIVNETYSRRLKEYYEKESKSKESNPIKKKFVYKSFKRDNGDFEIHEGKNGFLVKTIKYKNDKPIKESRYLLYNGQKVPAKDIVNYKDGKIDGQYLLFYYNKQGYKNEETAVEKVNATFKEGVLDGDFYMQSFVHENFYDEFYDISLKYKKGVAISDVLIREYDKMGNSLWMTLYDKEKTKKTECAISRDIPKRNDGVQESFFISKYSGAIEINEKNCQVLKQHKYQNGYEVQQTLNILRKINGKKHSVQTKNSKYKKSKEHEYEGPYIPGYNRPNYTH